LQHKEHDKRDSMKVLYLIGTECGNSDSNNLAFTLD